MPKIEVIYMKRKYVGRWYAVNPRYNCVVTFGNVDLGERIKVSHSASPFEGSSLYKGAMFLYPVKKDSEVIHILLQGYKDCKRRYIRIENEIS